MLRSDRRKLQRKNAELTARVEEVRAEMAALAEEASPEAQSAGGGGGGGLGSGWGLHAAVAAAGAAVRWWLANETDAVQRKIALVILWPVGGRAMCVREGGERAPAPALRAACWRVVLQASPPDRQADARSCTRAQAAWLYGAMMLGCLPASSPALRRGFACGALLLVGYIARAAAEKALHGGGAGGRGGGRW